MQHTIKDSRNVGVADIGYHGDDSRQVAQSSTQQGDCEPVLMDEDRQVPEDQDESEENEDDEKDEECCEEEVSLHGCNGPIYLSLCSILSRIVVMWEWQTLVTMVTIVVKWHRAVLSKEIVSQC